ncbi:MAG: hypothetical protein ACJZ2K_02195, partial [Candidatus Poseidoniaceae archaeon]
EPRTAFMRRFMLVIIIAMMMPQLPVSANQIPFEFYIEEEVVVHPDETVPFRIAWHNIANDERHFQLEVESHSNITVDDIPENWTRVASGRLGEFNINVTADSSAAFETVGFTINVTCLEVPDWELSYNVDALISKWSNLEFGANNGSSFYVQQNVNTSLAVNISNSAGYDDLVKIRMQTSSNWQYGFVDDLNGDKEVDMNLLDGEDEFIYFWIVTPSVVDGAPLAGTGPNFILEAVSGLDKRIVSWSFEIEMQTFHNISIDATGDDLKLDPGDTGRVEVTVRNTGNIDTYLDASLKIGTTIEDRIENDGWTVALFNAFEFQTLSPNESRIIEIGFESPNMNNGNIEVELIVKPQAFPQRVVTTSISSEIQWNRSGVLSSIGNTCLSVEWNETCQRMVQIENTGNFFDEFILQLTDSTGMGFSVTTETFGLSKGEVSGEIPVNLTPFTDAEGLQQAYTKLELRRLDGLLLDSISIESLTAPYVNWVWEQAESSVNDGDIEVVITMRNEGNTADGLIVRMSSSYYTELSFIPPSNSIFEDGSTNIRSFEVINIAKGENFTFRAWAKIPDDQSAGDDFFLTITANSRLAEDNPFTYVANSSFAAKSSVNEDDNSVVDALGNLISTIGVTIWAWKWIVIAACLSGLMINKSLRDRRIRLEFAALNAPVQNELKSEDWMAEFANKKQAKPEIIESASITPEDFTGMFESIGGPRKQSAAPVDANLVGAANTVLDHHDNIAMKSKLDDLANQISMGNVSKPHAANVDLPDDAVAVTERTVAVNRNNQQKPNTLDLDDLDL